MSSLNRRTRIEFGINLNNSVEIVPMTVDPEVGAGFTAPVGSIGLLATGAHYIKFGPGDNDWENRLLPFPYERFTAENLEVTNTTSNDPVTHLTLAPVVRGGTYEIKASFGYSRNNTGSDIIVRLEDIGGINGPVADTTVPLQLQQEMKDSAGTNPRHAGTGTNQALYTTYAFDAVLPAGLQTFNLTIEGSAAAVTVSMFDARLSMTRVE